MEECKHYWVIPSTPDVTCQGMCRKCHARKEFLNRMPGNEDWEDIDRRMAWTAPRAAVGLPYTDVP